MDGEIILYPQKIKKQCDEMITELKKLKDEYEKVANVIFKYCDLGTLTGKTAIALKNKAFQTYHVFSTLYSACGSDISDLYMLKAAVGDRILTVVDTSGLSALLDNLHETMAKLHVDIHVDERQLDDEYGGIYRDAIKLDKKLHEEIALNKWNAQVFETMTQNTKPLFDKGFIYRNSVSEYVLNAGKVGGATFSSVDDNYNPQTLEDYINLNWCDGGKYDWIRISGFLESDMKKPSDFEFQAFVHMLEIMELDDYESFFETKYECGIYYERDEQGRKQKTKISDNFINYVCFFRNKWLVKFSEFRSDVNRNTSEFDEMDTYMKSYLLYKTSTYVDDKTYQFDVNFEVPKISDDGKEYFYSATITYPESVYESIRRQNLPIPQETTIKCLNVERIDSVDKYLELKDKECNVVVTGIGKLFFENMFGDVSEDVLGTVIDNFAPDYVSLPYKAFDAVNALEDAIDENTRQQKALWDHEHKVRLYDLKTCLKVLNSGADITIYSNDVNYQNDIEVDNIFTNIVRLKNNLYLYNKNYPKKTPITVDALLKECEEVINGEKKLENNSIIRLVDDLEGTDLFVSQKEYINELGRAHGIVSWNESVDDYFNICDIDDSNKDMDFYQSEKYYYNEVKNKEE